MLQVTLPNSLMSVFEILKFVIAADCFKYFDCLSNPLNCTCGCSFNLEKFLKTKIVGQLFEINYVTIKIRWLCNVQHREGYIGHYWSQYRLDDFASRNARRSIFLWANGYYGVQIYSNQISSISTNKLLTKSTMFFDNYKKY